MENKLALSAHSILFHSCRAGSDFKRGNSTMDKVKMLHETSALASLGLITFGIFNDATQLDTLKARLQEFQQSSQQLVDAAQAADRDLTDEEVEQIQQNATEAKGIQSRITALELVANMGESRGRRTVNDDAARQRENDNSRRVPARPNSVDQRTFGFKHMGDFAMCCLAASRRDETAIGRLGQMNEGIGEDGGYLVPPEFREGILKIVEGEESLFSMTDRSTTSRNAVTQTLDETTPWGTAGIQAYWEGEAQAAAASNAKLGSTTLRLNKLFGRVDVTDELLEDAPQLDSYLRVKMPEVMTSILNLAIVSGNGVGKPLGIINSPALVTVAKEISQPADTIHHRNIVKMWSRLYGPWRSRAVWLVNQDAESQFHLMSFRDGTSTPVPVYLPPNGLSATPYGTLMGRPVIPVQAMETLGDLGDIIFAAMPLYRTVTKTGGTRVDTSIHLKFDTDETVFRFIFRVAGAPWISKAIAPRDGANTYSAFVALASRE